jgi:hypothetical protein
MTTKKVTEIIANLRAEMPLDEINMLWDEISALNKKYQNLILANSHRIEFTRADGRKGTLFIRPFDAVAKLHLPTGKLSNQYVNLDKLEVI